MLKYTPSQHELEYHPMRFNPFKRPDAHQLRREQRDEAERHLVEHEKSLEWHASQIAMYRTRLQRLSNVAPNPVLEAFRKAGEQK